MISRLKRHLDVYKIHVLKGEVQNTELNENRFISILEEREIISHRLVIATGTEPVVPSVPLMNPGAQNHIFTGIRRLKEVTGKEITIIGGGDAGFDYALSLSGKNKVSLINRSNRIRALPLLWKRASGEPGISYHPDHTLVGIDFNERKSKLVCSFSVDNSYKQHFCDYLIFATGRKPVLGFLSRYLEANLDELQKRGKVYLVGDVRGDRYRQAAIAAGEGIRAAMSIADEGNQ
jgi:thioredoxin reductase